MLVNSWKRSGLIACAVAMLAIANLQYAWTLFTTDLTRSMHASLDAVQWTLTFFIIAQTGLFPINAYLVDRYGPRLTRGPFRFLSAFSRAEPAPRADR